MLILKNRKVNKTYIIFNSEESPEEDWVVKLKSTTDKEKMKPLIAKTFEAREVEFEEAGKITDLEERISQTEKIWTSYPHYQHGRLVRILFKTRT